MYWSFWRLQSVVVLKCITFHRDGFLTYRIYCRAVALDCTLFSKVYQINWQLREIVFCQLYE